MLCCAFGACRELPNQNTGAKPVSHAIWDLLLKKHVASNGLVNYKGFIQDSVQLNQYLTLLKNHHPGDSWDRKEQLAYWINAYNAFTIDLVIRHYPVESIKDIGPKLAIVFVNTVWDIAFINIQGTEYSLNNIEHQILRKKFDEPRIHFAINCASISCPDLRPEAFTAEKIEQQLEEQAFAFIGDPTKNQITSHTLMLSSIFNWFGGDFKKQGTLRDYIQKYTKIPIDKNAKVKYLDYNWSLNDLNTRP
jgi:hypothetical protein